MAAGQGQLVPPRRNRPRRAARPHGDRAARPGACVNGVRPTPVRPTLHRGRRRRHTPIVTPVVAPAAVLAEVQRLCHIVLRSDDLDALGTFAADYDPVDARTTAFSSHDLAA